MMKIKMKKGFMLAFIGAAMFLTSCADTASITPDAGTTYAGTLNLNDAKNDSIAIYASDVTGDQIKTLVNLTTTGSNMRRVYITKNVAGAGAEPFSLTESSTIHNLGDGSLNLDAGKNFTFELNVPKNPNLTGGTEVYKIWATNGKGDYRDTSNSFQVGIGTVTIVYGGGNNPAAPVKAFSAKILAAPLADGTSQSFISTVNGQLYTINGAAETSAFWDFGYYYGANDHASLVSTNNYPKAVIDIRTKAGLDASATLNHCYITKSTKVSGDFDAISARSDLDFVTKPTTETVTALNDGDILEFVDQYGKKGMIRVVNVQGTYNKTDYIEIDVKVQR